MKRLIYILLLLPFLGLSQVNFSTYGAVGNGIADDTAALNAALAAETNLIADPGATFKISNKLLIETRSNQVIEWNNSEILCATRYVDDGIIKIKKGASNGGTTTMNNLVLNGNNVLVRGIYIETRVVFNNVTVTNLNQGSQGTVSPAGIYVRVKNDADSFGTWEFNDVTVTNLVGTSSGPNSNCVVASNTDGSVNGILWYWDVKPTTQTIVTWNNLYVDGMWGDDGGGVFINDNVGMKTSTSKHVFNNSTINNCERRALKGFSSNMEFNNVTFEDALPSDPNIQCGTISGLVVFGSSQRANIHFDNCTFIGHNYDGRVIPIAVEDWSIKNSTFTGGAYIAMTNLNGTNVINGLIEANNFGTLGYISKYGTSGSWTNGSIGIDTNNTWGGGSPDIRLSGSEYYSYTSSTVAVTGITWSDDSQTVEEDESLDLSFDFTPSSPSNTGYSLSSSNTGVISNAGAIVGTGTANLTITADDTTNGTISDVMAVTVNSTTPVSVTGIVWDDDVQSIAVSQTVDLAHTFSPSNATNKGYSLSTSNAGVVNTSGVGTGTGTANLTITTNDGSYTDVMAVTVTAAALPEITSITIDQITDVSFRVDWNVNPASKGQIRFGTTTGVYIDSTAFENNYLSRHIQSPGPLNPYELTPGTDYFFQIYLDDGTNSGWSSEYTATTTGATDPLCDDGIKNGDETGTDCGGSCSPCANSRAGLAGGKIFTSSGNALIYTVN